MSDGEKAPGRVLALDPGEVRIGVAVCDSERVMAVPLAAVPAYPEASTRCADLAREESAVAVVVGLPLRLDGTPGDAASRAGAFADELRRVLDPDGIEVLVFDERLTTVTASARLKDAGVTTRSARGRVDSAAAVVLLEAWLAR